MGGCCGAILFCVKSTLISQKPSEKFLFFKLNSLDNFSSRVFCIIFCHHHHSNQFLSFLQPSSDEMFMTIAQLSCLLGFPEFRLEICVVLNISWSTCFEQIQKMYEAQLCSLQMCVRFYDRSTMYSVCNLNQVGLIYSSGPLPKYYKWQTLKYELFKNMDRNCSDSEGSNVPCKETPLLSNRRKRRKTKGERDKLHNRTKERETQHSSKKVSHKFARQMQFQDQ